MKTKAIEIYEKMESEADEIFNESVEGLKSIKIRKFDGTGFSIAALFDEASNQAIAEVAKKIYRIGDENGISLSVATVENEVPFHATILGGKYLGEEAAAVYTLLNDDKNIHLIVQHLNDVKVTFDCLVINESSILLAADNVPEEILNAREKLKDIYIQYSLQNCKPYDPILFMTLARIKEIPVQGNIVSYHAALEKLKKEIEENPITIETSVPYVGVATKLIPNEMIK